MTTVALLIMWLAGFGAVCLFYPGEPLRKNFLLKACLGYGAGAGLTSILYFINLACGAGLQEHAYIIEPVLAIVLLGAAVFVSMRARPAAGKTADSAGTPISAGESSPGRRMRWIFPALLLCVAVLAAGRFSILANANPHGQWDAWGIWNLHARYLYEADEWKGMFEKENSNSHPDYPLLLPASVARVWSYACDRPQSAPILIGLGFGVCTALLMFCAVRASCGAPAAAVACAIVLGSPGLVAQSASQYADIPFAYYLLCAAVLLTQAQAGRERLKFLLAGLMLGLACWLKNEGLLCLAVLSAMMILFGPSVRQWRSSIKAVLLVLVGTLPGLAAAIYYKFALAPDNYLQTSLGGTGLSAKLFDPQRYLKILSSVGVELINQDAWGIAGCAAVLIILLAAFGLRKPPVGPQTVGPRAARPILPAVLLILAGYCAVYLITPFDVDWQLKTSLQRVMLHVWPMAVFAVFYIGAFAEMSSRPPTQ
ncbi:MAG: glycosyltransferase family 39 protein [Planctomycetes bacterium]|nr:glycosyltransferase family 39 protein [Planctomycetota bacterium]